MAYVNTRRTRPAPAVAIDKDTARAILKHTAETTWDGGIGAPLGSVTLAGAMRMVEDAEQVTLDRRNGDTVMLVRAAHGTSTLYVQEA